MKNSEKKAQTLEIIGKTLNRVSFEKINAVTLRSPLKFMKNIMLISSALLSLGASAKNLDFKLNGKTKKTFSHKSFSSGKITINGKEIGSIDKTLFNVWRQYKRTYRGYSFHELLDAVYGKSWRSAHKIVFMASDGYRQTANIQDMLNASEKKNGYIAFTETGKKGFSTFQRGKKTIDPGPFYLVWRGFDKSEKAKHENILKWPYQLKVINILSKPK